MIHARPTRTPVKRPREDSASDTPASFSTLVKRRRAQVTALSKDIPAATMDCTEAQAAQLAVPAWTDSHEKENQYQVASEKMRRLAAAARGHLLS
eukprot:2407658-Pyramimonas_sp.AAC.1